MKKRYLFIVSMLCMLFVLVGCGSGENKVASADGAKDPKALMEKAGEKLANIDSFEMAMNIDMGMDVKDQGNVQIKMTADASTIMKPKMLMDMNMKMDMTMGEENQAIEMRQIMDGSGDEMVIYQNMFGAWSKISAGESLGMEELVQNPQDMMKTYTESMEKIEITGDKTVNGKDCYEITMTLGEESMNAIMEQMGGMESLLGVSASELESSKEILDLFKDAEFVFYIDKQNEEFVGMYMELGEILKKAIAMSGEGEDIGDCTMSIEAIYKSYNSVKEIVIPEEAKSAE